MDKELGYIIISLLTVLFLSLFLLIFFWGGFLQTLPKIKWGKNIRVILDVGCGVASFGGYLLDRDVITMSLAPKDEHEAQIQFALERGIPAILSVIGTQKLTFPDDAYDLIHCARCRVHWDAQGILHYTVAALSSRILHYFIVVNPIKITNHNFFFILQSFIGKICLSVQACDGIVETNALG